MTGPHRTRTRPGRGKRAMLEELVSRRAMVQVTGPSGVTWTGKLTGLIETPTMILAPDAGAEVVLPQTYHVTELPAEQETLLITRETLGNALAALGITSAQAADMLLAALKGDTP